VCVVWVCGWRERGAVPGYTGHTHTGHTDRENTPDTGTHTRTTRPPNEHQVNPNHEPRAWVTAF